MPKIYFTQYLRPGGTRKTVSIERPDNIAKAADKIKSHGFRFECEVLRTGMASLTISDDDGDYAFQIVPANSPAIPAAVYKLISEFNLAETLKERERAR